MEKVIKNAEEIAGKENVSLYLSNEEITRLDQEYHQRMGRKAAIEEMMNSIQVGSKIMTIGGIIGVITEYDPATDYYTLNVGTKNNPSYMVIVKNAIRSKLDDSAVISYEPPKAEEKKDNAKEEKKDEF